MEFPSLGARCSLPECKRLDFLPFRCAGCDHIFCLEHRTYDAHRCHKQGVLDRKAIVCPVCSNPITVPPGIDPNDFIFDHINSGCLSKIRASAPRFPCSVRGCKNVELTPLKCGRCRKNHCVAHRFEDKHQCNSPKQHRSAAHHPPASSHHSAAQAARTSPASSRTSAAPPPSSSSTSPSSSPPSVPAHTTVRVRLPDAHILQEGFDTNVPFSDVLDFIHANRTDGPIPFSLRTTYPPHVFSPADSGLTLAQLGLAPSAMIIMEYQPAQPHTHTHTDAQRTHARHGAWGAVKGFLASWSPWHSAR